MRRAQTIDRRTARIPPPTFIPTDTPRNSDDNPSNTQGSTYSDMLSTFTLPDLSDTDSVQEYDEWIKSHRPDRQKLEERISIDPSTVSLIKHCSRKAKKSAKVDKFELFKEGRDDRLRPYYQHHIRLVDSRRSMRSEHKKEEKQRGPRKMQDLLEGGFRCLEVKENPPMEEVKVDINVALELQPILSHEDARNIKKLVKDQKSRLKPHMKKYSGSVLHDPLWGKWEEEDKHNLKRGVQRVRPPLISPHVPEEYGPASLAEVLIMVDNTARLPEVEYVHKYGQLGGIVPKGLDAMDMGLLHRMDPPVYRPIPVKEAKRELRLQPGQTRRPPILSRKEMEQMKMETQAKYDERHQSQHQYRRPQRQHVPVPELSGTYDQTLRSYSDLLSDDINRDPWLEKVRGIGNFTSSVDWNSAFINHPERYHKQAAGCDTAIHRARYGSPTTNSPRPARTIGQARRQHPRLAVESEDRANTFARSPFRSPQDGSHKRKCNTDAESQFEKPVIDPRLDMPALRDIILIPEAKIDHKKIRTVEPMASAHELTNFFSDLYPQSESKALTIYNKTQTKKQPTKQVKTQIPKFDWKRHKSIQNPKWCASSLRLSASRVNEAIPTYIANSVLQIRPLFRALESVNFKSVELESQTVQYVDMILSPSTGVIFTSLAKFPQIKGKLLEQIKSAAFYFTRVVIVLEVIPYRLFKDPKSLAECTPLDEEMVKTLSAFKRALEISVNTVDDLIGSAEVMYSLNGAQEVADVLRGITIKLDDELLKNCKGDTLALWRDKTWAYREIERTEEEYLTAAGFNLYSARFILQLCGTFMGLAEGMTAKERLEKIAPVVGQKFVTRFNAKWWRRQMESKQLQIEPATSETL